MVIGLGVMTLHTQAQQDSLRLSRIHKTDHAYTDFVVSDQVLVALTDSGDVVLWDLQALDTLPVALNDTGFRYTAIARDTSEEVHLGTNTGDIFRLHVHDRSVEHVRHVKYYVYGMCFNSVNKLFLIVPNAVYDPEEDRIWWKFKEHHAQIRYRRYVAGLFWVFTRTYFILPEHMYLDEQDRWWMYSDYGEYGIELYLFDTRKEEIYTDTFPGLDVARVTPTSVFGDGDGNTFLTQGGCSWPGCSGRIHRVDTGNVATVLFDGLEVVPPEPQPYPEAEVRRGRDAFIEVVQQVVPLFEKDERFFVGPGAYSSFDHSVYFSSSEGFYRAVLSEGDTLQQEPQSVWVPRKDGSDSTVPLAVEERVEQVQFLPDGTLLFLTSKNGFGLYNGERVVYLK